MKREVFNSYTGSNPVLTTKIKIMIEIKWTSEKKEKAIELLTVYFEKYGNGECIAQGDNAQIEAIELVCDIADNILIEDEGIIYKPEN